MRPLAGAGTGAVAAKLVAAGPSEASGAAQAAPTETFRKSRREVFCFMMTSCFECRRGLRRSLYRHTINVPLAAQGNPGAAAPSPEILAVSRAAASPGQNYANFVISILGLNTSFDFCSSSQVIGFPE